MRKEIVMSISTSVKLSVVAAVTAFMVVLSSAGQVSAHVTVKPSEVTSASYQTFTVNVPNEKTIPTVGVRVVIPSGVSNVTPTIKSGWEITTEKDKDKVTSITWSGGEISDGLRDEFTFSAKTPDTADELQWKAYQTYADSSVVAWDKAVSEMNASHGDDSSSGPLSVTNVTTRPVSGSDLTSTDTYDDQSIQDAQAIAQNSMYASITAIIIGLVAVYFATRKK